MKLASCSVLAVVHELFAIFSRAVVNASLRRANVDLGFENNAFTTRGNAEASLRELWTVQSVVRGQLLAWKPS